MSKFATLGLHKEVYTINGNKVHCIANFETGFITIHTPFGSIRSTLAEYEEFDGTMRAFAKELMEIRFEPFPEDMGQGGLQ